MFTRKTQVLIFVAYQMLLLKLLSVTGFQPSDKFFINCGGKTSLTLQDGRTFKPDNNSSSSSSQLFTLSPTSSNNVVSVKPSDLHGSARIFTEQAEYNFETKQNGLHLLRLHFYSLSNSLFNIGSAAFSVAANEFILLHNFSCKILAGHKCSLVKEYILQLAFDSDKHLILKFIPADDKSTAFINAIELFKIPDRLLGSQISPHLALETIHRINVGGSLLDSKNDSLWRVWVSDNQFLINPSSAQAVSGDPNSIKYLSSVIPETAPSLVYATAQEMADANVGNQKFNISWNLAVDSGFRYLIRLHFCDFISKAPHNLLFNVYINNQSMLSSFDISSKAMGLSAAYFVDFDLDVKSERVLVQVGPINSDSVIPNAILNGLEIMKLSDSNGILDATKSIALINSQMQNKKRNVVKITASCLGGSMLLGFSILVCMWHFRRQKEDLKQVSTWSPSQYCLANNMGNSETKTSVGSFASSVPSTLGLRQLLAFSEIKEATKNFDESLLLGIGGFGKVYKGVLENGVEVAVKRGNPRSQQGLVEFRTEIEMLSKLRHRHLVSLIGYCHEANEMVLVYEYMAGGPLRKHLYGSDLPALSWKQRIEICIGAAKGLHYLHTGAAETIIHRDVKTTNILLDENLEAKVADFGLSKLGPAMDQTHVSTAVKGSFGYLDPEYFRRQQLTEKSDVYSFGVVLLEVLCARPTINPTLPREQVNIAEWAMHWQKRGQLERVIDPNLVGKVSLDSLRKFGETAEKCLAEHGADRPAMGDVLWNLEYALQLQESFTKQAGTENSISHIQHIPEFLEPVEHMEHDTFSIISRDGSDATTSTSGVFSQLMNPKGR